MLKSSSVKNFLVCSIVLLSNLTKAGNECCKLPFESREDEKEEEQEVTERLAAAEEITVDAAVWSV